MGGGHAKMAKDDDTKYVVVITGCSDGGIGASLALEFAKTGFQVVATSRSIETMKELSLNENIRCLALDVTDFDAGKACVDRVLDDYGRIDVLVNNAGIPCAGPVAELPLSALELTFRTNALGPIALTQAVVPHMVARGNGKIVNVGSITTVCYGPWVGGYISSKAALEALNDALRMELKPFGIDVVLILPGAIKSNITKRSVSLLESEILQRLNLYKPFKSAIVGRATAADTLKTTPSDELARVIVPKILSNSPPAHFAYGQFTKIFTFCSYLPIFVKDHVWAKLYGLDQKLTISSYGKTD